MLRERLEDEPASLQQLTSLQQHASGLGLIHHLYCTCSLYQPTTRYSTLIIVIVPVSSRKLDELTVIVADAGAIVILLHLQFDFQ